MKQRVNHYSDELKLKVVQEYLSTDSSQSSLVKKYKIRDIHSITKWMRKFGLQEPNLEEIKIHTAMTKEIGKTEKEKALEAKINQLEKELEHEKLRVHALDTMITIAERELNIPIRKKPGTKQ